VINHDDTVAEWAGADLQLSKVVFESTG